MNTSNFKTGTEYVKTDYIHIKVKNGIAQYTNVEIKEKLLRLEIKNKFS